MFDFCLLSSVDLFLRLGINVEVILTISLLVHMDSKIDIIFYRGKSKFVAPSYRMIANSDNEQDREYVPLIAIPTTPPA